MKVIGHGKSEVCRGLNISQLRVESVPDLIEGSAMRERQRVVAEVVGLGR